jgi:hypothetical protein
MTDQIDKQDPQTYDSEMAIAEAVQTLQGMCDLERARHEAGYVRRECLQQWVVRGRYFLDSCGNWMIGDRVLPEVPLVFPLERLGEFWTTGVVWRFYRLPPPEETCAICQEGWTADRAWNCLSGRCSTQLYHRECYKLDINQRTEAEFRVAFTKAGFQALTLTAIPNQYCSCDYCASWYEVQTEHGVFRVGHRKRVVSLDWSGTGANYSPLFLDENVTRWDGGIHAWTSAALIDYLQRIRNMHHLQEAFDKPLLAHWEAYQKVMQAQDAETLSPEEVAGRKES